MLRLLGKGTCAKVFLVQKNDTEELFAMKVLRKDFILDMDLIESSLKEKRIMEESDCPFINDMKYCFTTDTKIYFIMKFFRGGSLLIYSIREKKFLESRVKRNAA